MADPQIFNPGPAPTLIVPGMGPQMSGGLAIPQLSAPMANVSPAQAPSLTIPSPMQSAAPALALPQMSNVSAQPLTPLQQAQQTSNDLHTSKAGIDTLNPWLRAPLKALEIAGSLFGPTQIAESMIPGTNLHHALQVHSADANTQRLQQLANEQANQAQVQAATANENLQPAYKQQQMELAQEKQTNTEQHQQDTLQQQQQHQQDTYRANLAQHGFAPDETDPTGKTLRPLRYEEMAPTQQAVYDLKASQSEEQDAQAAMNRAKNDPSSPAYQQAQARISVARQNAQTAMGRLGLSQQQFDMRSRGTDAQGNPLPGALIGDNGTPVGTAFQQNVRPTGQERNKADLANSAGDQIGDLKAIVQGRPDIFGPAAGRRTDFQTWLGSQDPDAQRFRAARTIAGDHLAGVFGGRSEAALSAIDNAIGQFKDNPAAVMAGLDQLGKANTRFQQAGTVHTAGSNAERVNPNGPPAGGGHSFAVTAPNGAVFSFKDQASANNFKREAGIK